MTANQAARSTRPWRGVIRVVLAFALMSAVGVVAWARTFMTVGTSYWWECLTVVDVAKIVGTFAGILTFWFSIAALLSGVLAQSSRPSPALAACLGIVVASVLGGSFLLGLPILGVFVAPLLAGLLAGWRSWPREGERDTLVPN